MLSLVGVMISEALAALRTRRGELVLSRTPRAERGIVALPKLHLQLRRLKLLPGGSDESWVSTLDGLESLAVVSVVKLDLGIQLLNRLVGTRPIPRVLQLILRLPPSLQFAFGLHQELFRRRAGDQWLGLRIPDLAFVACDLVGDRLEVRLQAGRHVVNFVEEGDGLVHLVVVLSLLGPLLRQELLGLALVVCSVREHRGFGLLGGDAFLALLVLDLCLTNRRRLGVITLLHRGLLNVLPRPGVAPPGVEVAGVSSQGVEYFSRGGFRLFVGFACVPLLDTNLRGLAGPLTSRFFLHGPSVRGHRFQILVRPLWQVSIHHFGGSLFFVDGGWHRLVAALRVPNRMLLPFVDLGPFKVDLGLGGLGTAYFLFNNELFTVILTSSNSAVSLPMGTFLFDAA
mmetsp:Transcript_26398/g.40291  ORF Transcript_26398/g.40291 Transcript_26398/m.40291 type:complete len:399 (-) Transcript_26398:152-1348(-)